MIFFVIIGSRSAFATKSLTFCVVLMIFYSKIGSHREIQLLTIRKVIAYKKIPLSQNSVENGHKIVSKREKKYLRANEMVVIVVSDRNSMDVDDQTWISIWLALQRIQLEFYSSFDITKWNGLLQWNCIFDYDTHTNHKNRMHALQFLMFALGCESRSLAKVIWVHDKPTRT